jgi:nucleotide-binding universal stress UspA family protein
MDDDVAGRSVAAMKSPTVLVGIDNSAGAPDAFALGERLAELLDGRLETVTVAGPAVGEVLAQTAAGRHAAVIVLGPTHRHALARTLRGTARRVLVKATCPVAVAPAGYADRTPRAMRRIGVGFEPTPAAQGALVAAHELAARSGGSLSLVGTALPISPLALDDLRDRAPYLEEERRVLQDALDRAVDALPAGVPTRAEARIGDPAVELAALSASVDLLVCGSRSRGPARAAFLGSVTERLLPMVSCPLLIVPGEPGQPRARTRRMRSAVLPPPRG